MRILMMLLLLPLLADCASIPVHTVCIFDVEAGGAQCSRTNNSKETFFKPLSELDGYIMRSPRDEQAVIEWAKRMAERNCKQ